MIVHCSLFTVLCSPFPAPDPPLAEAPKHFARDPDRRSVGGLFR